ncbi:LysM-like peptidoglycan-binding domain-containing protein [Mannheimia sp. AT1]|uniref:LysM-like peptidoglycan-binding domain-containing protein n=1 Tax=Mannheimia cairinae TaxID=3025936 RepID=A0ABT5MMR6_9PAST|nr:LysM-like peptidoglycan-binding domain-containing protein [Mannheimia cairinae]MDD0823474.1 LysM-like peptidoglycan-binding domain-containing protein [Mannheimia cairinae]MDD0826918.1 LysM-like peptidoglycan-binding domain-containing protein [Mannheimia cairinae]
MTQNNFRKEPVFGDASTTEENVSTNTTQPEANNEKAHMSLHSTQSPGYTFTPMMEQSDKTTETATTEPVESAKGFQFTPSAEAATSANIVSSDELVSSATKDEANVNETVEVVASEPTVNQGFTTERVIPNNIAAGVAATATAATLSVNEAIKSKMPPKTRRLLLVALIALALLVVFFLLKPKTPETVEELQSQQGSSLPIEFRPVDEEEAKRAEEQARAEQEAAKELQQQQEAKINQQAQQGPVQAENQAGQESVNQASASVEANTAKPSANQVAVQPVTKPQTQGSVVYQPEVATAKPQPQPKVERVTPQRETAKVATKPVQEKAPARTESARATSTAASATTATKTMTVPKGVSLMQVFRDNNLNIADVNAMSKVNNIVSNLKVGERITVRLDKNNRVVEMSIGSGGTFTRQANGNYTFK